MANIGQYNHLRILKKVDFGLYLDAEELGEILLPKRYVTADMRIGDSVRVFIYSDSNDYLVATTETPKVLAEHCAHLKVVSLSQAGAFLDWGLPKDLLVPYNEQHTPMTVGKSYVVYVYVDENTQRMVATSRLHKALLENGKHFEPGDIVDLLICGKSELGYKAVINDTHLGLIHHGDVFQPLHYGQRVSGFIKAIRQDQRIDLSLNPPSETHRDELCEQILVYLAENDGHSKLTDKSPPELIYEVFQVSKAAYKKALGALYKQGRIELSKEEVRLLKKAHR